MKCFLIVNQFLHSNKFNEIYIWLETALKKYGFETELKTNADLMNDGESLLNKNTELPSAAVFWDKDIELANFLEKKGIPIYNSSAAIQICDDKILTYNSLIAKNIPTPRTIAAPMTYRNIGYTDKHFIDMAAEALFYPMVIKHRCGSFGAQVYLAHSREEAYMICSKTNEPLLFQKYIAECCGQDLRLNMVGRKCVAAMKRTNKNDFRANITGGGKAEPYSPTRKEIELAQRACEAVGLDFGGVDILQSNSGPLVCEINSNAHFKSIYDCTGINAADYIAEYIYNKIKLNQSENVGYY